MTNQIQTARWWQAPVTRIAGMTVGLLIAVGLTQIIQARLEGLSHFVIGGVIAILPAALWLTIFYFQNRALTPPKAMVKEVFIASILLAAAVGVPLVRSMFRIQDWFDLSVLHEALGAILIVGVTQEFLKFAAVRWTVYPTEHFREHLDGILFAVVASLGYTTVLNLYYVYDNPSLDLAVGVIRVTITTLSQAAFACVLGYFLGRAKFEGDDIVQLPKGLVLAALLNGIFTFGREQVNQKFEINLLNSLFIVVAFAAVVLPGIFALMQRAAMQPPRKILETRSDHFVAWVLIGITLVALGAGWYVKNSAENRTRAFQSTANGISLMFPAYWSQGSEEGALVAFSDPRGSTTFVSRPRAGMDMSASVPVVVIGEDVLWLKGQKLFIFSRQGDATAFARLENIWRNLLASVRLD
ncbi:MAG: PrsW family intramembrane metalloprotease [Chloroflexi bacterium]|nr:PrsW family intramembrane metalloprotease [Chloroflexota bacterium]